MVVCDAVLRKLPGALGHEDSAVEESFSAALDGNPEYPHYTRPAEYRGWRVPEVLLSGHHERIGAWRRERSRERGRPTREPRTVKRRGWCDGSGPAVRYHCSPRGRSPACGVTSSGHEGAPSFIVMSSVIETIERAQLRRVPDFAPGDRVKVHFQVIEGTRRRVQIFEGVVIKRQGHGARETFTVRKQSFGVGVERMFPVHSPKIERIELAARGDVRRAKLYYLRDRVGKRARVRERRYTGPEETVEPGLLHQQPAEGATDADGMTAEEAVAEDATAHRHPWRPIRARFPPRPVARRQPRSRPQLKRRWMVPRASTTASRQTCRTSLSPLPMLVTPREAYPPPTSRRESWQGR